MATLSNSGVSYVISAKDQSKTAVNSATAGAKRVGTATERMAAQTKLHLANMRKYWFAMKASITAAAAAVIAALATSVSKYAAFEKEMANVSTLVDTNVVSMAKLQKQILSLNPNLGSAAELTKGLYQALSAGVDSAKAVEFVGLAAQAAKAGLSDTFTAVDAGTTILNAFGLEIGRASEVYDLMFTTVKEGKTTFEELAAAEAKISPIAAAANVSIYEQHAALATLTKGGFKTTEASSRLATALGAIIKPSSDAVKTAEELGLKFDAQALKAQGLHGFLQSVKEATGGNVEEMAKLFGGMESLSVMLALTGKQSDEFTAILNRMKDTSGATEEAFNKQKDTLSALWETTKNWITREAALLGEKLAPKLKEIQEKTIAWIEANRELIGQKLNTYLDRVADAAVFIRDGVSGVAATFNAMAAGALTAYAGLLKIGQGFAWLKSKVGIGEEHRAEYAAIFEEMKIEAEAAMAAATALAEKSQTPFLGSQSEGTGAEERAQALREELETRNEIYRQANEALAQQNTEMSDTGDTGTTEDSLMELEERLLARNALYYQFNEELAYGEMETQAMKLARNAAYYAMDQETYDQYQKKKLKTAQSAAKAETEIKRAVLNNLVVMLQTLGAENEAAAVLGIAISTGAEMVRAYQATLTASTLAFASQLIPGDPSSVARATAAAAAVKTWGMANVALIGAIGALRIGQTLSGGGSEGVNYTSDYSSSTGEIETAADTDTEENTERSISVAVNVYGNMVGDYDSLARDLVASIRKAEADGV